MLDHPTINQLTDESEAVATIDRVLLKEHCHRCGGLMIHDNCLDVQSDSGEVDVKVLRCFACGELIDPIILLNRMRRPIPGSKLAVQPQLKFADSRRRAHHDSLTNQVLETWSSAVRQNDLQGNSKSN